MQRRGIFNFGAIRSEVERRSDGLCASHTPVVFGCPLSTDVDPLLAIYDASVETVTVVDKSQRRRWIILSFCLDEQYIYDLFFVAGLLIQLS